MKPIKNSGFGNAISRQRTTPCTAGIDLAQWRFVTMRKPRARSRILKKLPRAPGGNCAQEGA
jgi:hypothetical protein